MEARAVTGAVPWAVRCSYFIFSFFLWQELNSMALHVRIISAVFAFGFYTYSFFDLKVSRRGIAYLVPGDAISRSDKRAIIRIPETPSKGDKTAFERSE
ncbi:hypothetical protein B0T24DRAFT_621395 [Lasiosphaeria ovina]|uniref:Uncharacterized protein n=1 Tax=Lasiosphaeria ovina TaxID=92902 RepID=A0AAE0N6S2_9PEZI|nr:hypothetical protein B0T24DRAFT_621395 [Lasiosphaeria ovina]